MEQTRHRYLQGVKPAEEVGARLIRIASPTNLHSMYSAGRTERGNCGGRFVDDDTAIAISDSRLVEHDRLNVTTPWMSSVRLIAVRATKS